MSKLIIEIDDIEQEDVDAVAEALDNIGLLADRFEVK